MRRVIAMLMIFASLNAFAKDADIAIEQILGVAKSKDVSATSTGLINSTNRPLPQNASIDAQLKAIEADFMGQVDSVQMEGHDDGLASSLLKQNGNSDVSDILAKQKDKRLTISDNDPLIAAAKDNKYEAEAEALAKKAGSSTPESKKSQKRQIVTCIEGGTPVVKKCKRTRIVKAIQPPDMEFPVTAYFASYTHAGHHTSVNIVDGSISYNDGGGHSGQRVENFINSKAPGGEVLSVTHTGSRWWSEAGVHEHEAYSATIQQPCKANGYVFKNRIEQGGMGSKKNKNRNGDKTRGRVETWQVKVRPAPIIEEYWDETSCLELQKQLENGVCEGPAIELLGIDEERVVENCPTKIQRSHWQEVLTYSCGEGRISNECIKLLDAGCAQINSECVKTKGPYCVEYLQTFDCGVQGTTEKLAATGGRIHVEASETQSAEYDTADFTNSLAKLSLVNEIKSNIIPKDGDQEGVLLFRGDALSCDKDFGSDIKNCCNLTGIFKNIIGGSCPAHVKEILAPAVIRERRCHEVAGWHCVEKYPSGMGCRKWRKSFCCFQSDLARVFQQIAHHQLGISWGDAENPNCAPLDPQTFGNLDFDDPYAQEKLKEIVDKVAIDTNKLAQNANKKLEGVDVEDKVKALQNRIKRQFTKETGGAI